MTRRILAVLALFASASAGDDFTYDPAGRRDPFVSQRKVKAEARLVQEVSLRGIVKGEAGYVALLQTSDGKTRFVRIGDEMLDGKVVKITRSTVTFEVDKDGKKEPVEFKLTE